MIAVRAHGPAQPVSARQILHLLALVALALVGAGIGAALAPSAHESVGPLDVAVRVRPSLNPGVTVALPPVGAVRFDTHNAPLAVQATIQSVDVDVARRVISSPARLDALQQHAPDQMRHAVVRALLAAFVCALVGAAAVLALATRGWYGALGGVVVTVGCALVIAVMTAATFDGAALSQPQFTGVLSSAPYVQRQTETLAQQLESYRSGLSDFVQSVTTLYAVGDQLSTLDPGSSQDVTTVLHVSDIHLNPIGLDLTTRLVKQFGVDAVVDSGDLSTWSTPVEESFVGRVGRLGAPYVFVRGNHDSRAIARAVARQKNAIVLDGDVRTVAGLRMAGIADPRNTPSEGSADGTRKDAVAASVQTLAGVVDRYDLEHPRARVQLAVVHDPTRLDALYGNVPLVLSGHLHQRSVREQGGTRVMTEGTTGGAGLTSNGLQRLTDGEPVPLEATLLYFKRSGPDAGRLLAYDEVTVGGLGLTSVSIDRTTVPVSPASPDEPSDVRPSGVRPTDDSSAVHGARPRDGSPPLDLVMTSPSPAHEAAGLRTVWARTKGEGRHDRDAGLLT